MELSQATLLAFTVCTSLRIFSYGPQIAKVAVDANGATAISYSTWALWTAANVATALYAAVNLGDFYLAVVSVLYASCCLVVIVLTIYKRRRVRTGTHPGHDVPVMYFWIRGPQRKGPCVS